jgi:hypothetical protein
LNHLDSILAEFDPVSLEETCEVKLMNRIDRKYWFHSSQLEMFLVSTLPYYHILEIDGERLLEYQTTYFDTTNNKMYLTHHNQKLNRYKVRRRKYIASDISFFEVKLKNNKRRTVKERIQIEADVPGVTKTESDFLSENMPFWNEPLQPTLNNHFYRLTLVHKEKKDRCTIDIVPTFWNARGEVRFENLVIFELKRGQSLKSSPMVSLLREMKIRQRGLSKYCMGRAILEPELKQNAFKPRLRFLQKEILN